jgi:hypothetical protein
MNTCSLCGKPYAVSGSIKLCASCRVRTFNPPAFSVSGPLWYGVLGPTWTWGGVRDTASLDVHDRLRAWILEMRVFPERGTTTPTGTA